jgi:hypothetical protein
MKDIADLTVEELEGLRNALRVDGSDASRTTLAVAFWILQQPKVTISAIARSSEGEDLLRTAPVLEDVLMECVKTGVQRVFEISDLCLSFGTQGIDWEVRVEEEEP